MERKKIERPKSEYDQKILDIRRVARTVSGGRRFSFRVTVVLGDKKGKVGVGTAKGLDVSASVEKAVQQARKNMVKVNMHNGTIPHTIEKKVKSAKIILRPAKEGTGIIAGGAVRAICDVVGLKNITGKITGKSTNKINIALATVEALKDMRPRPQKQQRAETTEKAAQ